MKEPGCLPPQAFLCCNEQWELLLFIGRLDVAEALVGAPPLGRVSAAVGAVRVRAAAPDCRPTVLAQPRSSAGSWPCTGHRRIHGLMGAKGTQRRLQLGCTYRCEASALQQGELAIEPVAGDAGGRGRLPGY